MASAIGSFCEGCYLCYGDFVATYFRDPGSLFKLVQRHGILPEKKLCEKCGKECKIDFNRKAFRCHKTFRDSSRRKTRCNFFQSIYKGTWFSQSLVNFETNLRFVNLFVQDFFSYKTAKRELGLSTTTIWNWASLCREVLVSWCMDHEGPIGAVGEIVEMDESKFGRHRYNVGSVIEAQWVFGGFCRKTRSLFMVPVKDRTSETLLTVIKERVAPGSIVISDCWKAYECLGSEEFQHLAVNQSYQFVDPETVAQTSIKRQWQEVKKKVPVLGLRKKNFVGYLATALFKMQQVEVHKRFHTFLVQAAKLYPPPPPQGAPSGVKDIVCSALQQDDVYSAPEHDPEPRRSTRKIKKKKNSDVFQETAPAIKQQLVKDEVNIIPEYMVPASGDVEDTVVDEALSSNTVFQPIRKDDKDSWKFTNHKAEEEHVTVFVKKEVAENTISSVFVKEEVTENMISSNFRTTFACHQLSQEAENRRKDDQGTWESTDHRTKEEPVTVFVKDEVTEDQISSTFHDTFAHRHHQLSPESENSVAGDGMDVQMESFNDPLKVEVKEEPLEDPFFLLLSPSTSQQTS